MNKKPMAYIILSILLVLFIQQCTTINLFSQLIKKAEYNAFPYLKEGVESAHYKIELISNPYRANISYDSKNNYFFIAQAPYLKIDQLGIEKAKIVYDKHLDNPAFTHYLFDREGVYDFSQDTVKKVAFSEIVNTGFSMGTKEWHKLFDEYYHKAQVVVYGEDMDYKYHPVYLKIKDDWVLFFMSSYDGINQAYEMGLSFDGYPAKFNKMVLLKATKQKMFSNGLTKHNLSERRIQDEAFALQYPKSIKVKKLSYKKEMLSEHFPYTSIPQEFSGIAYYQIKIDNDILYFKEKALKYCFSFSIKTYLYYYVLPEKYIANSKVRFLEYSYPHNINESGSNGLYIIKEKPNS